MLFGDVPHLQRLRRLEPALKFLIAGNENHLGRDPSAGGNFIIRRFGSNKHSFPVRAKSENDQLLIESKLINCFPIAVSILVSSHIRKFGKRPPDSNARLSNPGKELPYYLFSGAKADRVNCNIFGYLTKYRTSCQ